jgi:hypothetical protein
MIILFYIDEMFWSCFFMFPLTSTRLVLYIVRENRSKHVKFNVKTRLEWREGLTDITFLFEGWVI